MSATQVQTANTAPVVPPLRGYQTAGVGWMAASLRDHKAVLLCDDPGLGKTLQALTTARPAECLSYPGDLSGRRPAGVVRRDRTLVPALEFPGVPGRTGDHDRRMCSSSSPGPGP